MPCAREDLLGTGDLGWLCGAGIHPCVICGRMSEALCDFPMGEGHTCDLPLCAHHRIRQGGDLLDIDFCPQHVLIARQDGERRREEERDD